MRKRYVSFSLAGGRYCIPVDQVLQILRLEDLIEIPKPPPFVEGVINLRGDIIPVVSLRARMEITGGDRGADGASRTPRKRRVVIIRVDGKPYGLDVDEVREIVEIDEEGITTRRHDHVRGARGLSPGHRAPRGGSLPGSRSPARPQGPAGSLPGGLAGQSP